MGAVLHVIESKSTSHADGSWPTGERHRQARTPMDMSDVFGWIVSLTLVGILVVTLIVIVALIVAIVV